MGRNIRRQLEPGVQEAMIHYESRNNVKPTNKNKHFKEKHFLVEIKKLFKNLAD